MPGLADLIATAGLATDDPDEGSGPAPEGMGRLQHMNGSRCRAHHLGTVADGLLPAAPPELASLTMHREVLMEQQGRQPGPRRLVGIDLGIASRHSVRVLEADGLVVCRTSCVPTTESLTLTERAALAGAPEDTQLAVAAMSAARAAHARGAPCGGRVITEVTGLPPPESPGRLEVAVLSRRRPGWLAWLAAAARDISVNPAAASAVARQQARTASAHLAATGARRRRRTAVWARVRGPIVLGWGTCGRRGGRAGGRRRR